MKNFKFVSLCSILTILFIQGNSQTFPCNDNALDGLPCSAIRWEEGAAWLPDGNIDESSNAGPPAGIIRCGSSADTQSQIPSTTCYDSQTFEIDVESFPCVEPSSGNQAFPINPTEGEPIIWLNFDIRPNAGSFQVQINDNSGDNIAWALYYSNSVTYGTTQNPISGEFLSGDCSDLTLATCGIESANSWNTLPVPSFTQATNYYLAMWDQDADGDVQVNNFKARNGCGDATILLCNIENTNTEVVCSGDGTYTVYLDIAGINGEYVAEDPGSIEGISAPACLDNPGLDNTTTATLSLTYNDGDPYDIIIYEVSPSTITDCAEPNNSPDCFLSGISSNGPFNCCDLSIQCAEPPVTSHSCRENVPQPDPGLIQILDNCGDIEIYTQVVESGTGCVSSPGLVSHYYIVVDTFIYDEIACGDPQDLQNPSCPGKEICQVDHTYVDSEVPQLNVPLEFTVECGDDSSPEAIGFATAVDGCIEVDLTYSDSDTLGNCPYHFIRTWTATDACGNSISEDQIINISDDNAPLLSGTDQEFFLECDQQPTINAPTASDECDEQVQIIPTVENIPGNCPNSWTEVYRWTATDECGNQSVRTHTYHFSDNTAPVLSGIPENATVLCDEIPEPAIVNAQDNCDFDLIVDLDAVTVIIECGFELTRTWTTTDQCGNSVSESRILTLIDTEAPTLLNVPNDEFYECDGSYPAAQVDSEDNCDSEIFVEVSESTLGDGCDYVITYTYTVADDCGNQSTDSYSITVIDTTPPVLSGTDEEFFLECDQQPTITDPTATDECDQLVDIVPTVENIPGTCANEWTEVYRWIATDACGNQSVRTHTYHFSDNTAPSLLGVPQDITVLCDEIPDPAIVLAQDNCDQNVTVSLTANTVQLECGFELTRTWTAVDACGNTHAESQVLTLVDEVAPVLLNVPEDETYFCNGSYPAAQVDSEDNCDSEIFVEVSESTLGDGCDYVITYTYTVADDCGNQSTDSYSITVIDTTPPVLSGTDEEFFLECDQQPTITDPTATDECDQLVDIVPTVENIPGTCANEWTEVYRWIATDACGNQSVRTHTYHFSDNTAPSLLGVPQDITVLCDEIPDPAIVLAQDNCDQNVTVSLTANTVQLECGFELTRTWTAVDACGNTHAESQVLTLVDEVAPVLLNVPEDETYFCNGSYPAAQVDAEDNCDSEIFVEVSESTLGDGCDYVITYTYTVADDCGNQSTDSYSITVIDTTPPVLSGTDEEFFLECDQQPTITDPTATDECDQLVDIVPTVENIPGTCANEWTEVYRWIATDACGNQSVRTHTYHFSDNTAPSLLGVPQDITVLCDEIPDPAIVFGQDNCDQNVTVSLTANTVQLECGFELTRTWTATDDCGNTISDSQVLTLIDEEAPVLLNVPGDQFYACNGTYPPAQVDALDNCDQEIFVEISEETVGEGCEYVITYTYSVSDDCGNTSSDSYSITVLDETAPVLSGSDQEFFLECDQQPTINDPTATDECDQSVEITPSVETIPGSCPNSWTDVYSWTATDECGNQSIRTHTYHFSDNTAPSLLGVPQDITVLCDEIPDPAIVLAQDNCDQNVTVSLTANTVQLECGFELTRTWTATDDCGNTKSSSQTVNVIDNQAPIINCPPNYTVEGNGDYSPASAGTPNYSDECSSVDISYSDSDPLENGNIERTWIAIDDCGNQNSCIQIIIFNECPADFNGDGFITNADLLFLLSGFGCTDAPCPSDLTGDGITTLADLLYLLSQYGESCD